MTTYDKAPLFFDAAITMTKDRRIQWNRLTSNVQKRLSYVDMDRSFYSEYGDATIVLCRRDSDGSICCLLKLSSNLGYQQVGIDNDPVLLRLYNIVYSSFPSVDTFIDSFISDSQIQ